MLRSPFTRHAVIALGILSLLAATPAQADKPDFAGNDKSGRHDSHRERDAGEPRAKGGHDARGRNGQLVDRDHRAARDRHDDRDRIGPERRHFEDRQRVIIRNYYASEFRRGQCPPGLAKKRNGCIPPGLARQWRVGERLPRDVRYYDLPPALVLELGQPPVMHKYVRVGADILLIALGTGLVVDALEDLGGR